MYTEDIVKEIKKGSWFVLIVSIIIGIKRKLFKKGLIEKKDGS